MNFLGYIFACITVIFYWLNLQTHKFKSTIKNKIFNSNYKSWEKSCVWEIKRIFRYPFISLLQNPENNANLYRIPKISKPISFKVHLSLSLLTIHHYSLCFYELWCFYSSGMFCWRIKRNTKSSDAPEAEIFFLVETSLRRSLGNPLHCF
jgi:hypothetical protein